jgi:hypothetical protein
MFPQQRLYWVSQFFGWFSYTFIMWVLNELEGKELDLYFVSSLTITFILGILISHTYREVILQLGWLQFKIVDLIPRVILTSILCGISYYFLSFSFNATYVHPFSSLSSILCYIFCILVLFSCTFRSFYIVLLQFTSFTFFLIILPQFP